MKFRPCIDLHQGVVKQIVGGSMSGALETNFQSEKPARWFAQRYRQDNLQGGHVIQLGAGNQEQAVDALSTWPGGLQIGGGVSLENASFWLDNGASALIVTSWVFHDGSIDMIRLKNLSDFVGKDRLVLDLSCRRQNNEYRVVTNCWRTFTDSVVSEELLTELSFFCGEFLIHGVDVEGRCQGIEEPLVALLGRWGESPVTYAGGIRSMEDIEAINELGRGALDFTVGSALDLFGGSCLCYADLVSRFG